ncbi:spore germination protein [Paenibacillus tarimensis]
MPSIIVAPIKIITVSDDSAVTFGDVFQITPKRTSKSYSGSGGNTGDFCLTFNGISFTNTLDRDLADSTNQSVN